MKTFGDASEIRTTGPRGKTTRRRSAKTVRGPGGAWIAQAGDEIATRPAGWLVMVEARFVPHDRRSPARTSVWSAGRFDSKELAEAYAAARGHVVGVTETYPMHACTVARVWVEAEVK